MAKEVETKKRKASVTEQDAAKLMKPKKLAAEVPAGPGKKRKATEDATLIAVKKSKKPKSSATSELSSKLVKEPGSTKAVQETNGTSVKTKDIKTATKKLNGIEENSSTSAKKTKEIELPKPIEEEEDDGQMADEESEFSDIDDQTEALLKGFESDDNEEHDMEGGLKQGQAVPNIPTLTNKSKKIMKRLENSEASETPGVVYVGRIPHGFYENEMREYFKQFGNILKLRLSRNPKNGQSRHYAFIQFESAAVAGIVAQTMDNYLLFSHILKVKVVPDEQVHDELFKGANKRFKKVPWNKIRGRELEQGATEATWENRIKKEERRREIKAEKAKQIGYDFKTPQIKSAKSVAKKPIEQLTVAENDEEATKAIEAPPAIGESSKSKKKGKKTKPNEGHTDIATGVETASIPLTAVEKSTKAKKEKKQALKEPVDAPATEVSEKPKKKKEKTAKTEEINV